MHRQGHYSGSNLGVKDCRMFSNGRMQVALGEVAISSELMSHERGNLQDWVLKARFLDLAPLVASPGQTALF